jgi:hypothetical protein
MTDMEPIIVRYLNPWGQIETWIAPGNLTTCEIRWNLPEGSTIQAAYCLIDPETEDARMERRGREWEEQVTIDRTNASMWGY